MSQDSVYKFLRKQRRWMMTKEISDILECSRGSVLNSLKALFKYKEIERETRWVTGQNNARGYHTFFWRIK